LKCDRDCHFFCNDYLNLCVREELLLMTPAIRLLQREAVPFSEHLYAVDPETQGYGLDAASKLGVEPRRVFKTLVCQAEGVGLVLVLVPSSGQMNLRALARALGVKKADLAEAGIAERTTGYVIGGISPLGGRRKLPVLTDTSIESHETVFVNGGRRGLMLELSPTDLLRLTLATTAPLAEMDV
jgi:Cys-tRNA(Pro)/Cys-tRNA(Cys) deacylase